MLRMTASFFVLFSHYSLRLSSRYNSYQNHSNWRYSHSQFSPFSRLFEIIRYSSICHVELVETYSLSLIFFDWLRMTVFINYKFVLVLDTILVRITRTDAIYTLKYSPFARLFDILRETVTDIQVFVMLGLSKHIVFH